MEASTNNIASSCISLILAAGAALADAQM